MYGSSTVTSGSATPPRLVLLLECIWSKSNRTIQTNLLSYAFGTAACGDSGGPQAYLSANSPPLLVGVASYAPAEMLATPFRYGVAVRTAAAPVCSFTQTTTNIGKSSLLAHSRSRQHLFWCLFSSSLD